MDRRQKKTRASILMAFNQLLLSKRYSDITVQEIIDLADVGRSTFYAHFETKDSLLNEMCEDLVGHILNNTKEVGSGHDFSGHTDFKSVILHMLCHLTEQEQLLSLLSSESSEVFQPVLKRYLNDIFAKELLKERHKTEVPKDFLLNHITTSFLELVMWWIHKGKKEHPKELTEYFFAVVHLVNIE